MGMSGLSYNFISLLLITFLLIALPQKSYSSEDKKKQGSSALLDDNHMNTLMSLEMQGPVSPSDLFERTQYILKYLCVKYGFEPEPSYQSELQAYAGQQTLAVLNKMLPFFDASKQFNRFSAFENNGAGIVHVYQDRDVRKA